jgi:succinate dehydrogenase / fumarate reductase cytochrome b subunit
MDVKRPLSPHLQIYKVQLTSVLSILHRMTGSFLMAMLAFGSVGLWALSLGQEAYEFFRKTASHPFFIFIYFSGFFSLFYHLGNGIRHLVWDSGKGYDLPTVYVTGWMVVVFAIAATVGVFLWIF